MDNKEIKKAVKKRYSKFAQDNTSCCPTCNSNKNGIKEQAQSIGYSTNELKSIPESAVMGLGCGNPTAIADLNEGETVLDLGSGAGIDVFFIGKQGR